MGSRFAATPRLSCPPSQKRSFRQRHWIKQARRNHRAGDEIRAFDYLSRAAVAGDSEAQTAVGLAYLAGKGVPVHPGAAAQWFERAANCGDVAAMVYLAKMALQGLASSGSPDFATGRTWAANAAEAGAVEGTLLLGNLHLFGPAEMRDVAAAADLFRTAAGTGNAAGQLGLALALLQGGAAAAHRDEITCLIERAAGQGLAMAAYLAGARRQFGLGIPQDVSQAAEFYRRAAAAGVRPAQTRYGFALLHGLGVSRSSEIGESWLRKAALGGCAAAATILGVTYAAETELPPNFAEACIWFRRAAELGALAEAGPQRFGEGYASEAAWWVQRLHTAGPLSPSGDPASMLADLYTGCA